MTQIIAVATHDYLLFVSDRKTTELCGNNIGRKIEDDRCKLVVLCNSAIIGYSGLAELDGVPTHEWIAHKLCDNSCVDPLHAIEILRTSAAVSVQRVHQKYRNNSFLVGFWGSLNGSGFVEPIICTLSNMVDHNGVVQRGPVAHFSANLTYIDDNEHAVFRVIGSCLDKKEEKALSRNASKLARHKIGPNEMLRLMRQQILRTAASNSTAGNKILCCCIPKQAVLASNGFMVASTPAISVVSTYTLFDPELNREYQEAPLLTCNKTAAFHWGSDVGDEITSSVKFLRIPGINGVRLD